MGKLSPSKILSIMEKQPEMVVDLTDDLLDSVMSLEEMQRAYKIEQLRAEIAPRLIHMPMEPSTLVAMYEQEPDLREQLVIRVVHADLPFAEMERLFTTYPELQEGLAGAMVHFVQRDHLEAQAIEKDAKAAYEEAELGVTKAVDLVREQKVLIERLQADLATAQGRLQEFEAASKAARGVKTKAKGIWTKAIGMTKAAQERLDMLCAQFPDIVLEPEYGEMPDWLAEFLDGRDDPAVLPHMDEVPLEEPSPLRAQQPSQDDLNLEELDFGDESHQAVPVQIVPTGWQRFWRGLGWILAFIYYKVLFPFGKFVWFRLAIPSWRKGIKPAGKFIWIKALIPAWNWLSTPAPEKPANPVPEEPPVA